MEIFFQTVAGNPENQDRGAIIECSSRKAVVIADGAGGLGEVLKQQPWPWI